MITPTFLYIVFKLDPSYILKHLQHTQSNINNVTIAPLAICTQNILKFCKNNIVQGKRLLTENVCAKF